MMMFKPINLSHRQKLGNLYWWFLAAMGHDFSPYFQDFNPYFKIHVYDLSDLCVGLLHPLQSWHFASATLQMWKKISLSMQKLVGAGDRTWLAAGPHSWKGIHIRYAQEDHRLITSSTTYIPPHILSHTSHHISLQQHFTSETKAS